MADKQTGSVGENIKYMIDGKKLILEIDLGHEGAKSKSGKSTIVASTQGNASLAGVKVGLNVYK